MHIYKLAAVGALAACGALGLAACEERYEREPISDEAFEEKGEGIFQPEQNQNEDVGEQLEELDQEVDESL